MKSPLLLRMQFCKLKPRVLFYRDYTKFSNETFINSKLGTQSISPDENGFLNFRKIGTETSNKHAPCKRKTLCENQGPFINKKISKAIMKRTKLRKIFLEQIKLSKYF